VNAFCGHGQPDRVRGGTGPVNWYGGYYAEVGIALSVLLVLSNLIVHEICMHAWGTLQFQVVYGNAEPPSQVAHLLIFGDALAGAPHKLHLRAVLGCFLGQCGPKGLACSWNSPVFSPGPVLADE
jgi:hypothetical protein